MLYRVKALARRVLRPVRRTFSDAASRREYRPVREARHNPSPKARLFLTGDLGKLGSLIADVLKADYEIVGFDRRYTGKEDLANCNHLKDCMRGCEYVVHAAAIPHPGQGSIEDYVGVNVLGTFNVLKAAHEVGVRRFIYLSSTGYYGCNVRGKLLPKCFPIDEATPIASTAGHSVGGLEEYNQSKVMAEQLCAYYGTNKILEVVVLRSAPANTKAESYKSDFDWRSCTDYRRGCFFANCAPQKVAEAVKRAVEAPGPFWYEALNLADRFVHQSIDVREFLQAEYPDVEVRIPVTPHVSLIDTRKAQRILGWRPAEDLT